MNNTSAIVDRRHTLLLDGASIVPDMASFDARLTDFVNHLQDQSNAHLDGYYAFSIDPTKGSKNIRIERTVGGSSRSVECFVRKADGVIMKAAGWKTPFIAKGGPNAPYTRRGSIFDATTWVRSRWS
jgi:hypothetical protein